jgi:Endoribonuclease L-PSP
MRLKSRDKDFTKHQRLLFRFSGFFGSRPSIKYSNFKMSLNRRAVNGNQAPPPRSFYNQAIVANGFVFCSGQLPKNSSSKILEGTVQDRAVGDVLALLILVYSF